jgi:adenine-specific DNA methylase
MMAVVLHHPDRPGKRYRLPTARDLEAYRAAEQALQEKRRKLWEEWGMDPVPDEKIITPCHEVDRPPMYGMPTWGDLFNPRQKLALLTFADKVRQAHAQMRSQSADPDFAKAVATYLALSFRRRIWRSVSIVWLHHTIPFADGNLLAKKSPTSSHDRRSL